MTLRETLSAILALAVATCEREGFGIEDTDDMIAIRKLAEDALTTASYVEALREAAAVECTCRAIEKCDRCEAIEAVYARGWA